VLIETIQPVGVVVKHIGLWTRRREFESLTGYHISFSCVSGTFWVFLGYMGFAFGLLPLSKHFQQSLIR
jgi:hypothetical protein